MTRWLAGRVALAVLVVFGAVTATFVALQLAPGDPVYAIIGTLTPSHELVGQVRADLGLDQPVLVRYGLLLARVARGDLGTSYQQGQPVWQLIAGQFGATVELAVSGCTLAFVAAVLLAVGTAGRPVLRRVSATLELVAISSPGYWVGVVLLTFFSFRARLFPAVGGAGVAALVLPAITIAVGLVGVFTQVLREELERALDEPFVLSSRARGTGETTVRVRHALRHALIPMATLGGWTMGALLSGAVVVETVFNRPGIGRLLVTAVLGRDLPVVTGVVVVAASLFTVINLGVDLLYRLIDPRLRPVRPC
jgi:peptide/nickel transport system permease protein